MRVHDYPYRIVLGSPELLPLCEIYVLGPQARVSVTVLVDSGASYSVFHSSVARDAGLALPAAANFPIQYGGGPIPGRLVPAYVEFEGRRWNTEIVFVDKLEFRYGLLGRRGIFGQFNEVVFLEKVNPRRVAFRW